MKTKIVMLSMLGAAVLAMAAMRGGCLGEPCPDLYIACPDLECPQGFKVDKGGCAICECVGEVIEPVGCYNDADCQAGEFCDFSAQNKVDPSYCAGDSSGADYCGMVAPIGECRPIEIAPCAGLDEWSCIQTQGCEPIYDYACPRCEDEARCGDVACEALFIECRETPIDRCWGAWIDQWGQCRAPNDGVYPAECCGLTTCWSDSDCPAGFVCALPPVDCGMPVDSNGDGVLDENDMPVDCIAAGVCMPIEPPPDPCTGLDEQTCANSGCQALYEETCTLCEDGTLCDPMPCSTVFAGCVSMPLPITCFSNEECGSGMVCSFDSMTNCGGERPAEGGGAAPVNCGGVCVPA